MQDLLEKVLRLDAAGDLTGILRILSLLKAGDPPLRDIFDSSPAELPVRWPERRRTPEASRLLHYASPPAGSPRLPRRAVVAIRRLMLPLEKTSREFDL